MKALDLEERKALRRKALWRVTDFAAYLGISRKRALRSLLRYHAELGTLLRPSRGTNRGYTFFWATLAKHAPDAFLDDPIEQQRRTDLLEDRVADLHQGHRIIVTTVKQNTNDIERLKRAKAAA